MPRDRRTCPECGRVLDGLMSVDENAPDLAEMLTDDEYWLRRRALIVALAWLVLLAAVGLEAILR